jgi:hypothetical protein
MSFQKWLESQRDKVESAKRLHERLATYNIQFAIDPKNFTDISNVINKIAADKDVKNDFLNQVGLAFDTFNTEKKSLKKNSCLSVIRLLVLILIVGFLLWLLYLAFFGGLNLRKEFYNIEFARGVITFLFAIGTIGSALIIILSIFTSERSLEESKERFYRAKEILTILIGILGAIVGYYFGTNDNQLETKPVELSEIQITAKEITPGKPFNIISSAKGGIPPYTYSIYLEQGDAMTRIVKGQKTDQLIVQEITIPSLDVEQVISIDVRDAKGTLSELNKKITHKASVK